MDKVRLLKWGICADASCGICRNRIEDSDHLFLECPLSMLVWKTTTGCCFIRNPKFHWQDIMLWGEDHLMRTILKSVICKIALWSTVYHLWQLKNSIPHQGKINSEESISRTIKWEVKERVESKGGFCNSLLNTAQCCSWGNSSSALYYLL